MQRREKEKLVLKKEMDKRAETNNNLDHFFKTSVRYFALIQNDNEWLSTVDFVENQALKNLLATLYCQLFSIEWKDILIDELKRMNVKLTPINQLSTRDECLLQFFASLSGLEEFKSDNFNQALLAIHEENALYKYVENFEEITDEEHPILMLKEFQKFLIIFQGNSEQEGYNLELSRLNQVISNQYKNFEEYSSKSLPIKYILLSIGFVTVII